MKSLFFSMSVMLMGIASGAAMAAEVPPVSDFLCNLSTPAATALPGSNPAPQTASTFVCGVCSQDVCDNRNVGAFCKDPRMAGPGTCQQIGSTICVDTGLLRCECLEGDIN